jgi:hypothetical protein
MSDPEHFLARWARRKRAAAESVEAQPPADTPRPAAAPATAEEGAGEDKRERKDVAAREPAHDGETGKPAFDLARLPPVESITAETDIRGFLQPGVPPDLRHAALRRAWLADPAIRDFVELAEYAWDFTAPDSMAGFGPLEMTDALRREVAEIVGRGLDPAADRKPDPGVTAAQGAPEVETSGDLPAAARMQPTRDAADRDGTAQETAVNKEGESHKRDDRAGIGKVAVATQQPSEKTEPGMATLRRAHGRALPE